MKKHTKYKQLLYLMRIIVKCDKKNFPTKDYVILLSPFKNFRYL